MEKKTEEKSSYQRRGLKVQLRKKRKIISADEIETLTGNLSYVLKPREKI